jgi:hypothetical protein
MRSYTGYGGGGCVRACRARAFAEPGGKIEIIAIMDEERRGFDEMEALVLASLFWRRSDSQTPKRK